MSPTSSSNAQSMAIADALSGVIGSLFAMITFYPLDTIKTKIQANRSENSHSNTLYNDDNQNIKSNQPKKKQLKNWYLLQAIINQELDIRSLFRGIHLKGLHTITSSFAYFYLYSYLQSYHRNKKLIRNSDPKIYAGERMLLATLAAMLNVLVTLPLDVVSSRQQTGKNHLNVASLTETKRLHWTSYWSGLRPALLLCSNPAIHFTIYDVLRLNILQRRSLKKIDSSKRQQQRLSILESFAIGMIAKSFATILTYPLIRLKVLLMTNDELLEGEDNYTRTMVGTMRKVIERERWSGLFKGCDLQLIHTVMKSALLMVVREKISLLTHRLLISSDKQ